MNPYFLRRGRGGRTQSTAAPWSPATPIAPSLLLRDGRYAISAGTGTWTADYGTNYTGSGGTCPDVNAGVGPTFVRANSDVMSSADTTATLIGLAPGNGSTVAMVLNVTTLPGAGAYDFAIGDYNGAVGQWAIEWDQNGLLYYYLYDGGVKTSISVNPLVVGRNVIVARRTSAGAITIQANGGSDPAPTAAGTIPSAGTIYLGTNPISAGIYKLNAKLQFLLTAKVKWTDAEVALFYAWAATHNP